MLADKYCMYRAIKESEKSNDKNTKVGCIIVKDGIIVAEGHNHHLGKGLPDGKEGELYDTKYGYTIHAEIDAIINSKGCILKDSVVYVTLFPCHNCMCALITAGIKKLVYISDKYADKDFTISAKRLAKAYNISLVQIEDPIQELYDKVVPPTYFITHEYKCLIKSGERIIMRDVVELAKDNGYEVETEEDGEYYKVKVINPYI